MNQLLSNIIKLSTGSIAVKIIGIVSLSIYTRIFAPEELALLPVYVFLTDFALVAFAFGVLPTFIKHLPGHIKKDIEVARGFCHQIATIFMLGVVLSICVYFIFLSQIQSFLTSRGFIVESIEVLAIGFFIGAIIRLTQYMMWAGANYNNDIKCSITGALLRPILAIIMLNMLGPGYFIHAIIMADLFVAILGVFFCRHLLFGPTKKVYTLKGIVKMSAPFSVETYVNFGRKEGDTFFVSLLGATELAIYHVAKTFINALLSMFQNVQKVITQKMAEINEEASELYQITAKLLSLLSPFMSFGVMAFAPLFVMVIAPPEYSEAALYGFLLAFTLHLTFLRMPSDRLLFTTADPIYRLYISSIEAFSLIGLMLLLVSDHELMGIVVAKYIAGFITLVMSLFFLARVKNISHSITFYIWPSFIALVASCLIFSGIYGRSDTGDWIVFGLGCFVLLDYAVICYLLNRDFVDNKIRVLVKKLSSSKN